MNQTFNKQLEDTTNELTPSIPLHLVQTETIQNAEQTLNTQESAKTEQIELALNKIRTELTQLFQAKTRLPDVMERAYLTAKKTKLPYNQFDRLFIPEGEFKKLVRKSFEKWMKECIQDIYLMEEPTNPHPAAQIMDTNDLLEKLKNLNFDKRIKEFLNNYVQKDTTTFYDFFGDIAIEAHGAEIPQEQLLNFIEEEIAKNDTQTPIKEQIAEIVRQRAVTNLNTIIGAKALRQYSKSMEKLSESKLTLNMGEFLTNYILTPYAQNINQKSIESLTSNLSNVRIQLLKDEKNEDHVEITNLESVKETIQKIQILNITQGIVITKEQTIEAFDSFLQNQIGTSLKRIYELSKMNNRAENPNTLKLAEYTSWKDQLLDLIIGLVEQQYTPNSIEETQTETDKTEKQNPEEEKLKKQKNPNMEIIKINGIEIKENTLNRIFLETTIQGNHTLLQTWIKILIKTHEANTKSFNESFFDKIYKLLASQYLNQTISLQGNCIEIKRENLIDFRRKFENNIDREKKRFQKDKNPATIIKEKTIAKFTSSRGKNGKRSRQKKSS